MSEAIYSKLFEPGAANLTVLFPLLSNGASKMNEKLCIYAKDCLPGGCYWNPDADIKNVLSELKPSNDLCESILGLNDYLTTAIPNLHQMARSNLIQLKKNKTMKWLYNLPEGEQEVIDLAVTRRKAVQKDCQDEAERRTESRRENMMQAHTRREALKKKAQKEKDSLSQLHLITTTTELQEALAVIDKKRSSSSKKTAEKRSLIQEQVKIRRKVLGQNIRIVFTHSRWQQPVTELLKELSAFIEHNSMEHTKLLQDPSTLIEKTVSHKFRMEDTSEEKWYNDKVIGYDPVTKTHEIHYEGEDEPCHFDIILDLLCGDLKVFM